MIIRDYVSILQQRLSSKRFQHSMGVKDTAVALAKRYGANIHQAEVAGLLHDYAREIPTNLLLQKCEAFGIVMSIADRCDPIILHAPLAATLVKAELAVDDKAICQAIALHTTGGMGMSLLDKIIYVADCIEPHRHYPGVDKLREVAQEDMDLALLTAFDHSIVYLVEKRSWIHPNTIAGRNQILQDMNNE
ncbi:putative HD superfamily hydrolase involved in NAD metabolism [Sporomusaceae bacterium BoRhaA]|uniref:bis(5'-nucleosyl)-tetraphosphatase (symmetrical) YqeK n=1 Tax=Pelorhabdus rhamnosifermentans TaxID=2772457 RepID=UPI0028A6B4EF|nr:bis(5'-nucleosyl)-tetraphosphatase (symmetrical) YqeK [Pelorhabdus rhamnosifermentans]MBU2699804.1 putative HD superfamily hydrolase involved in NAD metabolism [Pelorhabdus rhamnosifermentans]